jgi:hypothetical protein
MMITLMMMMCQITTQVYTPFLPSSLPSLLPPPASLAVAAAADRRGRGGPRRHLPEMDACFSTQLIDGDGVFNVSGLENFMKEVKMGECGLSYAVVSIMGPQSSGKSTLLNHLFRTNFREMDAFKGRHVVIPF